MAVLFFLFGCQGPLFYDFVARVLKGDATTYAALMTALAAGTLAGAVVLGKVGDTGRLGLRQLMLVLAVDAVALYAFTYSTSLFGCLAWMMLMGLMAAAVSIILRVYLQTAPDPAIRGRILGVFDAIEGPITVISIAAAVYASKLWDSTTILRAIGIGELAVAAGFLLLFSSWYAASVTPSDVVGEGT
jgi:hypothetical protein